MNDAEDVEEDVTPLLDIPEAAVHARGPELSADGDVSMIDAVADSAPSPSVRPIQMGEFLRKWISRRLLALNKADIGKVAVAMRALGGWRC